MTFLLPFIVAIVLKRFFSRSALSPSPLFLFFCVISYPYSSALGFVLDSFLFCYCCCGCHSSSSFPLYLPFIQKKYRNFNATKYALNLLEKRKQKPKMSLCTSVRQTFCRIVSEKKINERKIHRNEIRFVFLIFLVE